MNKVFFISFLCTSFCISASEQIPHSQSPTLTPPHPTKNLLHESRIFQTLFAPALHQPRQVATPSPSATVGACTLARSQSSLSNNCDFGTSLKEIAQRIDAQQRKRPPRSQSMSS